jgi:hypothetical protein
VRAELYLRLGGGSDAEAVSDGSRYVLTAPREVEEAVGRRTRVGEAEMGTCLRRLCGSRGQGDFELDGRYLCSVMVCGTKS